MYVFDGAEHGRTSAFADFVRSAKGFIFYLRFKSFIFAIKKDTALGVFFIGSGIRIRTLNNGVRVRCVTVTLYRYAHRVCYYNTICRNVNTEF